MVVDAGRAENALATLSVGDLDATLAELAERVIRPASVDLISGADRKATVLDPDEARIKLGRTMPTPLR
ncbi:MAG TPA: hypothetical protein VN820_00145 [Acidimicrobiales bacterium]|nr:hypothetical protein [Acidimicrobiales bacterium]